MGLKSCINNNLSTQMTLGQRSLNAPGDPCSRPSFSSQALLSGPLSGGGVERRAQGVAAAAVKRTATAGHVTVPARGAFPQSAGAGGGGQDRGAVGSSADARILSSSERLN
jgi:hypothetical protein